MEFDPDLCPLTVVGEECGAFYIHPASRFNQSIDEDLDHREIVQFHVNHWDRLFQWNHKPIPTVILRIMNTPMTCDQFLYDQNNNILRYIHNPLERETIIDQHHGVETTIQSFSHFNQNTDILSIMDSISNSKESTARSLVLMFHLSFDIDSFKLQINSKTTSNNSEPESDQFSDIILCAVIIPTQCDDDSRFQIKFMLTTSRRLWISGNYTV